MMMEMMDDDGDGDDDDITSVDFVSSSTQKYMTLAITRSCMNISPTKRMWPVKRFLNKIALISRSSRESS